MTPLSHRFGRPQGVAYDADATLYVVDALAGDAAVYRVPEHGAPVRVLSGRGVIGLVLRPDGGAVVATRESLYTVTQF